LGVGPLDADNYEHSFINNLMKTEKIQIPITYFNVNKMGRSYIKFGGRLDRRTVNGSAYIFHTNSKNGY